MGWWHKVVTKSFKGTLETLMTEALDIALKEVHSEIEEHFTPDQHTAIKSGTFLLKQRLHIVVREKLENK